MGLVGPSPNTVSLVSGPVITPDTTQSTAIRAKRMLGATRRCSPVPNDVMIVTRPCHTLPSNALSFLAVQQENGARARSGAPSDLLELEVFHREHSGLGGMVDPLLLHRLCIPHAEEVPQQPKVTRQG